MTVQELIDELSKYPYDIQVIVDTGKELRIIKDSQKVQGAVRLSTKFDEEYTPHRNNIWLAEEYSSLNKGNK